MASKLCQKPPNIPDVPEAQRTPIVVELLDICSRQHELILLQKEQIQILKDEIARLKKQKTRPRIRPSKLENGDDKNKKSKKKAGSTKKSKTSNLTIHKTVVIPPEDLPESKDIRTSLSRTLY